MKNNEIENIEKELTNNGELSASDEEYSNSVKDLVQSILLFTLSGGCLTAISFAPIPLIFKVPLLMASLGLFAYNDCLRIDNFQKYRTLKELKENNKMDNSIEQYNISDENKEEVQEKKPNIFKRAINSFIQARKVGNITFDEEDTFIEDEPSIFKKISSSIKNRNKNKDECKNQTLPLPLPLEENELNLPYKEIETSNEPYISYELSKKNPRIAKIDLSNIHTEPGFHIESDCFGFEDENIEAKYLIVNKNDCEVNNYVAEKIETITKVPALYSDYTNEDEEKRVYILTK